MSQCKKMKCIVITYIESNTFAETMIYCTSDFMNRKWKYIFVKYLALDVKTILMERNQHMRVSTNTKLANVLKYIGVLPFSQWLNVLNFLLMINRLLVHSIY